MFIEGVRKRRICVTGAGGFIGHHLARRLKEMGAWVRGVDIVDSWGGRQACDQFLTFDLRQSNLALLALRDIDWVFALAADMGGIGYISEAHAEIVAHNTAITYNTINASQMNGVERLLFASSACVYPVFLQEDADEVVHLKEEDAYPALPEGCLTPDTEVMTKDGFKFIPDITLDDEVATLSPEGYLEFHKPSDKQVIEYTGKLIHFKARSYDCLVTPAHKVFAARDRNSEPVRIEAQKLIANSSRLIKGFFKRNCMWRGKQEYNKMVVISSVPFEVCKDKAYRGERRKNGYTFKLDDYLELLGWFITEGHCGFYRGKDYEVQIRQCDQDNLTAIKSLCDRMSIRASVLSEGRIVIHSKALWFHFKEFGHGAKNKRLPDWVLELPPERLRILYKAMMLGDGGARGRKYYTSSPVLRDQFIEICMKLGYACSVGTKAPSGNINEYYRISIAMKNYINKVTDDNINHVEYTGLVYDLTVPNHVFYIRRNGRHVWTGNSYGWEKLHGEHLCRYYNQADWLQTRVARLHNVYGPEGSWQGGREKAPAALCRKVAQAKLGGEREIMMWGDGLQRRSFMYIDDCVEGLIRLMLSDHAEPVNLGRDRAVSINELLGLIARAADYEVAVEHNLSGWQGVRNRCSDNERCRSLLGWEPQISLEEGIPLTYSWIQNEVWMKATE